MPFAEESYDLVAPETGDVAPPFDIQERNDPDGALRLVLLGELDLAVAQPFRDRLKALAAAHRRVRLDLSQLEFMDSSGLHVVIDARRNGWEVEVDPTVPDQVKQLFRLAGVDAVVWPKNGPAIDVAARQQPPAIAS